MRSFSSIAFLAAAAASTARAEIECADGLYMIVARGTGEDPDPGTGVTGNLTSKIADRIENSTVIGLDYPAGWAGEVGDDDFFKSVVLGYKVMKETMENYSVACPGHPIAAFGYSQGAQVLSDAVCGGSGGWFNEGAEPVDLDIIEKSVAAIILFGDPTFQRNSTFTRGSGDRNGIFERANKTLEHCEELSERIVSYCDEGDMYCGTSIFNINRTTHRSYIQLYGDEVVDLVVDAHNDFSGVFNGRLGLANENGEYEVVEVEEEEEEGSSSTTTSEDQDIEDDSATSEEGEDSAAPLFLPSFINVVIPAAMLGLWHVL